MLNAIWIFMVLAALVCGAGAGKLDAVTSGSVTWAGQAVDIAIGMVGMMALWLGLMRALQDAGLLRYVARALAPIMTRLFPGVPAEHPAMAMMILNMTANMLGLANAATPFGLKAMIELDKLNKTKGTATNAMIMFLAINTSELAIFPSGIIGLRTALGSQEPGSIIMTTWIATALSTLTAITAVVTLRWLSRAVALRTTGGVPAWIAPEEQFESEEMPDAVDTTGLETSEAEQIIERRVESIRSIPKLVAWGGFVLLAFAAFAGSFYLGALEVGVVAAAKGMAGHQLLLILMVSIIAFAVYKNTPVYDSVVEGGKEGFQVALRIIPYLVAILVAVGMLRESGAIDLLADFLKPVTSFVGMPPETLPMAMLRPLTGTGAYGVAAGTMKIYGPDSLIGQIVSTMQGSTETTFYVLALYYGVINIKNTRYTVLACLSADVVGVLAAVWACRLVLG
jgi:spore maturation protein SpmA